MSTIAGLNAAIAAVTTDADRRHLQAAIERAKAVPCFAHVTVGKFTAIGSDGRVLRLKVHDDSGARERPFPRS